MIIGYYPGGGGNRYYQSLIGKDYSTMGMAYDKITSNISVRGLYFDESWQDRLTDGNMLLHCVNSIRIREFTSAHSPIIIIKSDLKKSLRREWCIKGKFNPMFSADQSSRDFVTLDLYRAIKATHWPDITTVAEFNSLPDVIFNECVRQLKLTQAMSDVNGEYNFLNAAYTAIRWHVDLYNKWPFETSLANEVIDIDQDDSEFAALMRRELDLYNNALFDFAWSVYENYGADAPINSLYEQEFLS